MAKHITLSQLANFADGFSSKADERYFQITDAGDLATKDTVAKTDLDSELSDEISAATSDIADIESDVETLIGSDTSKSVRTIANEELAAQLIPANAQEALDTLQEISAWIQAHPAEASAINAKLELGTHEVNNEQVQYETVKAYVEAYVASQVSAAGLSGSNAIDITSGVVSLILNTANANGLAITANGVELSLATTSTAGAMSATDKAKLDGADVTAYTAGNGIDITNHKVSTVVDSSNANGLSVGANGIGLAPASASVSGVGGTAGAMTAADKEKLDNIESASDAEITAIVNGLYTS